jgi:hypothetical protein
MNHKFKYFKNKEGTIFYKIFRVCPNSPYMMSMCVPNHMQTWMKKSSFEVIEGNPIRVIISNKRTGNMEELALISEKWYNNYLMMLELQK